MGEAAVDVASTAVSYQVLFNGAVGLILFLFGFLYRAIWDSIVDLREKHNELRDADVQISREMAEVRELVAGQYVTREDFTQGLIRIERKLDTIFGELKTKQDKV
jgi:hypothetical protein